MGIEGLRFKVQDLRFKGQNLKWGLALCVLLLSSCSMQKRLYNKGFYASKTHTPKKKEIKEDADTLPFVLTNVKSIKTKEVAATLYAEVSPKIIEIKHTKTKPALFAEGCDTLFFRNGAKILAKVNEINPEQIKYKYCDSPNETLRIISKSEIKFIVYSNGFKEAFESSPAPYSYPPQNKKTNGFAIAGFVISMVDLPLSLAFGILSAISTLGGIVMLTYILLIIPSILALLAIMFCITALIQINKSQDLENGNALSIVGLVFAIILLIVLIAIIIALH